MVANVCGVSIEFVEYRGVSISNYVLIPKYSYLGLELNLSSIQFTWQSVEISCFSWICTTIMVTS